MLSQCPACGKFFNWDHQRYKKRIFCSMDCKLDDLARFNRSIKVQGSCWIWVGSKRKDGYGLIKNKRKHINMLAHRYSWELHRGPIPEGLCVCHNCPGGDNPSCVNPDHMFLGTISDNMRDAGKKGMIVHGSKHAFAKLTEDDVKTIRELYRSGAKRLFELAKHYGVNSMTLRDAAIGKSWKHVIP